MLVLVVVMGFLRMRRSVHANKNLPHQILKDKARLQSAKCRKTEGQASACPGRGPSRTGIKARPSETTTFDRIQLKHDNAS
jgi:hypothetical protein